MTRTVRLRIGSEVHTATQQQRTDSVGNYMFTCDCGRAGWGTRGLVNAHTRPSPVAPAQPVRTGPRPSVFSKGFWYQPMYDNRAERRDHFAWRLWQWGFSPDPNVRRPSRWKVRIGEAALCGWYGHGESAAVPGTCYYCNKRRGKRGVRWKPAPVRDPDLRPGERDPVPARPPIRVQPPLVAIESGRPPYHPEHGPGVYCPICARRTP